MINSKYQKYVVSQDDLSDDVSKISVSYDKDIVKVSFKRSRNNPDDIVLIDLVNAKPDAVHATGAKVKSRFFTNKILFIRDLSDTLTLVIFSDGDRVKYYIHDNPSTHPLTRLITVKSKTFSWLTRRHIYLTYACLVENRYNLPIKRSHLRIGNDVRTSKNYPIFKSFPSKLNVIKQALFFDRISLASLLSGEPEINSRIEVELDLDSDTPAYHTLTNGSSRIKVPKWYYAPHTQSRRDGYSISIRRNAHGGLNLVRRLLEPIELTPMFRFYESRVVSFCLYYAGRMVRRQSRQTVNIYFEKNSNQSEEGVLEFCQVADQQSAKSKNYFIIRDTAAAYDRIKNEPCVVANFTLKSYWLMYRANNVIASEVPQHMNILRSGNKYARMAPYSQTFVFLQHGVTYMKPQDKTTSFKKGREGEPDYIVVNSKKERDIVNDMLEIPEERILNTGMLIFDDLDTKEVSNASPDIVTIMLTWKPYEEHLQQFEESSYYRTTIELYELVSRRVGVENTRIVAHPKFKAHMMGTDVESALWGGTVSEALRGTKLLITDYSSVCYNVFYRGGAVIFFQPDRELYQRETGVLIPANEEYIGARVYSSANLQKLISQALSDNTISLGALRTDLHIENYLTINEHTDGNNSDRLIERLQKINIL